MTRQGGWPDTGFGRRLKEVREAAGLSQQQLADQAACRSETISRLERGEQEPAWPLVLALAQVLGVSVEVFVPAPSGGGAARKGATENRENGKQKGTRGRRGH